MQIYRFIIFLVFAINIQFSSAQTITVGATGDYPNLEAAEAFITAGTTVLVQSQTFSDGTQFLNDLAGTAENPIIIQAQNEHQAIFQGGTEGIHLVNCNYVELSGLVFEQQTGNGVNIDDGGDYSTPSTNIIVSNCIFQDMAASGNNDFLKMSGVDDFLIKNCQFTNGGAGGSGVDFVGCHDGTVEDCTFDNAGVTGIQAKGGTQFIRIQRNKFENISQRAVNLGGSTGLQFFRPPLSDPIQNAFEAADLEVFNNIFIGNRAPIAYVGCVRVKVYHNTIYQPDNWVMRILQETTEEGFLPCSNNEFRNNIVYQSSDLTEVNIGPNTEPSTFSFSNNVWFNAASNSWSPNLPVIDENQVIDDPLFMDTANEDFTLQANSPAIGAGLTLTAPMTDFNELLFNDPPSSGAYEGNPMTLANVSPDFVGHIQDEKALLYWKITPSHLVKFEIEHSTNYHDWQKIGELNVPTQQAPTSYTFQQALPNLGDNYYRLKIWNDQQQFSYSSIVHLEMNKEDSISLFPNPSKGYVYLTGIKQVISKVQIVDMEGKLVKTFVRQQLGRYDLSDLANGVYNMKIINSDNQTIFTELLLLNIY